MRPLWIVGSTLLFFAQALSAAQSNEYPEFRQLYLQARTKANGGDPFGARALLVQASKVPQPPEGHKFQRDAYLLAGRTFLLTGDVAGSEKYLALAAKGLDALLQPQGPDASDEAILRVVAKSTGEVHSSAADLCDVLVLLGRTAEAAEVWCRVAAGSFLTLDAVVRTPFGAGGINALSDRGGGHAAGGSARPGGHAAVAALEKSLHARFGVPDEGRGIPQRAAAADYLGRAVRCLSRLALALDRTLAWARPARGRGAAGDDPTAASAAASAGMPAAVWAVWGPQAPWRSWGDLQLLQRTLAALAAAVRASVVFLAENVDAGAKPQESPLAHFPVMFCTELGFDAASCRIIAHAQVVGALERLDAGLDGSPVADSLAAPPRLPRRPRASLCDGTKPKIRVGYLHGSHSPRDITVRAVGSLLSRHDRARFTVVCVAAFGGSESDDAAVAERRCDEFHRISIVTDASGTKRAATSGDKMLALARLNLDIVVDLNGHTGLKTLDLLATRPAAIQMHFHAFPSTMGHMRAVEHYAADAHSVDVAAARRNYAEKLVVLPRPYLMIDYTRGKRGDRVVRGTCDPTKADKVPGIPAVRRRDPNAAAAAPSAAPPFVFASFNGWFKIPPGLFAAWMEILRRVPGSILWMLDWTITDDAGVSGLPAGSSAGAGAAGAIRAAARTMGVDPARIVVTPKIDAEHELCAKAQRADLFLDSPLLNGHTTASDMAFAGLPVLTMRGSSATTSRVASSFAHFASQFAGEASASGCASNGARVPPLVADTLDAYVDTAVELGSQGSAGATLASHRAILECARPSLFDLADWMKDWERGLQATVEARCAAGARDDGSSAAWHIAVGERGREGE